VNIRQFQFNPWSGQVAEWSKARAWRAGECDIRWRHPVR